MNNKFKEPARLVQELEAIGLEAELYRNRTNKCGWIVCAWINLRNIDDIITSKNMWNGQIWEWGELSGKQNYWLLLDSGRRQNHGRTSLLEPLQSNSS